MPLDYKKLAIDFLRATPTSALQGPIYDFKEIYAGKQVPVYALAEGNACKDCNKLQSLLEYFGIKNDRFLYNGHKLSEFAQKYGLERYLVHDITSDMFRGPGEIGLIATERLLTADESEFVNEAIGKILRIGYMNITKKGEFNKFTTV
ncbi:MAG: hypothetical protein V1839_02730 [archaeon]